MKKFRELAKAGKFAAVGVINTLVDYGVFMLLTQVFGVRAYFANIAGYSCGMFNSYVFNRLWTFRAGGRFFSPAFVKFAALNLSMMGISTALLALLRQGAGLGELTAKAGATVLTLGINFTCSRLWVFRGKSALDSAPQVRYNEGPAGEKGGQESG